MNRQQSTPEPVEVLVAARRQLLLVTHHYLAALAKAVGLGTSDLMALMQLAEGDLAAKDLAAALGFTSASITILTDRLEAAGVANRKRHPTDRRAILLGLTAQGRRLVRRLDGFVAQDVEAAVSDLSEGGRPNGRGI